MVRYEKGERDKDWYDKLQAAIWATDIDTVDWSRALKHYRRYRESKYLALPFAGAWEDQPAWVETMFDLFDMINLKLFASEDVTKDNEVRKDQHWLKK